MALVGPVSENIDDAQSAPVRTAGDAGQVLTFDEIGNLTAERGKPAETLMNVVALIAGRFHTDVCSAYLLEPDRANLVLAATLGLRPSCVGRLRMGLNEGLAGLVAEQVRPVAVEQVKSHPRFKYFSEAGEEPYQSFLGVPLIDRGVLQGVLVVQTIETRAFREDEIRMLVQAAAQVAPVVSEARTLDRLIAPAQERPGARGMPASCALGRWPIFRPSSDCMNRSPSIRVGWACWPATTSKAHRT